jgi:hypothetical protein
MKAQDKWGQNQEIIIFRVKITIKKEKKKLNYWRGYYLLWRNRET